ncbi:uncharacterized protein E0L32_002924 [Thyridium curvatum]|uniref:Uncharacterized protein n=1 Tax=Thyridium curvatum TaxID=1093900 RepID=A0A507BEA9_9PEZI|nr:uncharacterized protein E0L32_002924 [Thyridium curvatum]TPX17823.1 hypothetical protein E0L32_002924 [Thyridium curvatum]
MSDTTKHSELPASQPEAGPSGDAGNDKPVAAQDNAKSPITVKATGGVPYDIVIVRPPKSVSLKMTNTSDLSRTITIFGKNSYIRASELERHNIEHSGASIKLCWVSPFLDAQDEGVKGDGQGPNLLFHNTEFIVLQDDEMKDLPEAVMVMLGLTRDDELTPAVMRAA